MASLTFRLSNVSLDETLNGDIDEHFHVIRLRLIYPNYQKEVMEKSIVVSLENNEPLKDNAGWKKSLKATPYHDIVFKTDIQDECWIEVEVSHGIKETLASKLSEELLSAAADKITSLLPFGSILKDFTGGIDFGPRDPKAIAHGFIKVIGNEHSLALATRQNATLEGNTLNIKMKAPEKVNKAYYQQGARGGARELVKKEVLKKGQNNGFIEFSFT